MPSLSALPLVSVIIPCFNHGAFIDEALNSIDTKKIKYPVEIIIVDDGSTDAATKEKLLQLQQQGYNILLQTNGGPAKARNTAVNASSGKYILALDADNKIKPDYINEAVELLEKNEYDIFYCAPVFFDEAGETSDKFKTTAFDINHLLFENYIDACAVYRRTVWQAANGYDGAMPYYGHEDWEFWLHAYKNGFRFHFSNQQLFYYRVSVNFVSSQFNNRQKVKDNQLYVMRKHADLYLPHYQQLYYLKQKYKADIKGNIATGFKYLACLLGIAKSPLQKAAEKFTYKKSEAGTNPPVAAGEEK